LFNSLTGCIKANTNQGFVASIQLSNYRDVDKAYELKERCRPTDAFLGMACLGRLMKWEQKKGVDWKNIRCVFEDGDEGQGSLIKLAKADGFNAAIRTKERIRAFDACDLAARKARAVIDDAWERALCREGADTAKRIMKSVDQIETVVRGRDLGMFSIRGLKKICELERIPERQAY
jgi:hypothetical protein